MSCALDAPTSLAFDCLLLGCVAASGLKIWLGDCKSINDVVYLKKKFRVEVLYVLLVSPEVVVY